MKNEMHVTYYTVDNLTIVPVWESSDSLRFLSSSQTCLICSNSERESRRMLTKMRISIKLCASKIFTYFGFNVRTWVWQSGWNFHESTFFLIFVHNRQVEAVKKRAFLWEVLVLTHLLRNRPGRGRQIADLTLVGFPTLQLYWGHAALVMQSTPTPQPLKIKLWKNPCILFYFLKYNYFLYTGNHKT